MANFPIELDDEVPFIKSEWIGQGKRYTDVPVFVQLQKDKDLEPPLDFLQTANLPNPNLPVDQFLLRPLQIGDYGIIMFEPGDKEPVEVMVGQGKFTTFSEAHRHDR